MYLSEYHRKLRYGLATEADRQKWLSRQTRQFQETIKCFEERGRMLDAAAARSKTEPDFAIVSKAAATATPTATARPTRKMGSSVIIKQYMAGENEFVETVNDIGLAIHEAGHAVMCVLRGIDFDYVTTEEDANSKGHLRRSGDVDKSTLESIALAGAAAQAVASEMRGKGSPDEFFVTWMANGDRALIGHDVSQDSDQEESNIAELVASPSYRQAKSVIRDNFPKVLAVADALMLRTTVWGDDVKAIMADAA